MFTLTIYHGRAKQTAIPGTAQAERTRNTYRITVDSTGKVYSVPQFARGAGFNPATLATEISARWRFHPPGVVDKAQFLALLKEFSEKKRRYHGQKCPHCNGTGRLLSQRSGSMTQNAPAPTSPDMRARYVSADGALVRGIEGGVPDGAMLVSELRRLGLSTKAFIAMSEAARKQIHDDWRASNAAPPAQPEQVEVVS